jgi:hypothetical protein
MPTGIAHDLASLANPLALLTSPEDFILFVFSVLLAWMAWRGHTVAQFLAALVLLETLIYSLPGLDRRVVWAGFAVGIALGGAVDIVRISLRKLFGGAR